MRHHPLYIIAAFIIAFGLQWLLTRRMGRTLGNRSDNPKQK